MTALIALAMLRLDEFRQFDYTLNLALMIGAELRNLIVC